VTGGSSGIGEQYCHQLAAEGFNIVIVSRSMTKMKTTEAKLKQQTPSVQVKLIEKEFLGNTDLPFYQSIVDEVKDLDISMLVNNVGAMTLGYFKNTTAEEQITGIDVNVMPFTMLTKLFLTKFLARKQKSPQLMSAIVSVSSLSGRAHFSAVATYCASKAFITVMNKSLCS
jgi:17beta-estradiol 17-dehydrogenase / very-long-chain 3-oxoacyl-CoA reductase